jgi:Glyoxalase-like domain
MTDTEERLWSRRAFVKTALAGAAAGLIVRIDQAADPVPSVLDHIILGIDDLDRGIGWMEEHAGVSPVFGGVHPGRGTRNALLSLGPRRYLEILAPDPQQASQNWYEEVRTLREPRLVGWFAHTENIAALARKALAAGFAIEEPKDGSRTRPDGKTLLWKSFRLKDNCGGLLPSFIEWSSESVHPAADAPAGCTLAHFFLQSPAWQELAKACQSLGLDVAVERGEKSLLRARIATPKSDVELTS